MKTAGKACQYSTRHVCCACYWLYHRRNWPCPVRHFLLQNKILSVKLKPYQGQRIRCQGLHRLRYFSPPGVDEFRVKVYSHDGSGCYEP